MTPSELAALHKRAMVHGTAWSDASFDFALRDSRTFLVTETSASRQNNPRESAGGEDPAQLLGFALGRVVADEAELLTLAVDPSAQRRGIGQTLLQRFEDTAGAAGAEAAFLEVSADNTPATGLYQSAGWAEVGQRPRYYAAPDKPSSDALILRKVLLRGR